MELIFFISACMVLRFGFMTKTGLKAHQCFSYYKTASRPSLFLTLPASQQPGGAHEPGQLTPNGQRDALYHMTFCSAIKASKKKDKGEDVCS